MAERVRVPLRGAGATRKCDKFVINIRRVNAKNQVTGVLASRLWFRPHGLLSAEQSKMRHGYGRGQTYACCEAASESQGCGSEMRDAKRRSLEEASN